MAHGLAVFESFGPKGDWGFAAADPFACLVARHLSEVGDVLTRLEKEVHQGAFGVLALSYEAAAALDASLPTKASPAGQALAVAMLYERALPEAPGLDIARDQALEPFCAAWDQQRYEQAYAQVQALLRAGECYQVNLTFPLYSPCRAGEDSFDLYALWRQLGRAFRPGFAAYVDCGEDVFASLSPELFFARTGDEMVTRPMKGTMSRGRYPAEDQRLAAALANCPKNRAENVMIVDLLRNDLGKLAVPGSVETSGLFEVERYPTVWQMVSTIKAKLRPNIGLVQTLAALFPCGSVTGAPKRAAMQAIAGLETVARGLYCGALGYLLPDGRQRFNVPIRTLTAARRTARLSFHVGSGVTVSSDAAAEWDECLAKARFLACEQPNFDLFETMLVVHGKIQSLALHMQRLEQSAAYFDRSFDLSQALALCQRTTEALGCARFRLRLRLSAQGSLAVDYGPAPVRPGRALRLALARAPREPQDRLCFHKTSLRSAFDAITAAHPLADDVLLVNAKGQLTETCRANIALVIDGQWLTPAVSCGLLPGVYRRTLLERGKLIEAELGVADISRASAIYSLNALRGLSRCRLVAFDGDEFA